MASRIQCDTCGSDIVSGPLGDICPVCLLKEGHSEGGDLPFEPVRIPGSSDFQDRGELPREFGGYDLLEAIAHGGMGIVYRARHRALRREVALKLLLSGAFASPDFVQRFQREAAAAASLRHPNIVGVYEVGEVDGQPYMAMEYVAGRTLAESVQSEPLPAEAAARYLQAVAEAVQHAHDHGLLHRDLKPSNVIVDPHDQPRVTDFGLAKQMDGSTDLTVTGQMLGSPNYLPPEVAMGREGQGSAASDVYSLGATLYHLLTGRPPLVAGSLTETLVRIREETPIAPRLMNPSVPADLDTICQKCLEKDPGHRYATARELAEDLGRWRRGEPIRARPAGVMERSWKWGRRHPAQAALAVTVALALVAVGLTSLWFNIRLAKARDESERNRQLSETNRLAAEASARASQASLIRMQVLAGNRLAAEGDPLSAGLWYAEALRQESVGASNRRAEVTHRRRLAGVWASAPRLVAAYAGAFDYPDVQFSPDGRWLLLAGGQARLLDLRTGKDAGWFAAASRGYSFFTLSPKGDRMVELSSDRAHPSRLWRLGGEGSKEGSWMPLPQGVTQPVAFSPDGRRFLTGGASIRFWDTESGVEQASPLPTGLTAKNLEFSADGRRLLVRAVADSSYRVWDLESGTALSPAVPGEYYCAPPVLSPDGEAVVSSGREGDPELALLRLSEPGKPRRLLVSPVFAQAFHPSGRWFATGHWDGRVRMWSADTLEPIGQPLVIPGGVVSLAFTADGSRLAAAGFGKEVRVWDVPEGRLTTAPMRLGTSVSRVTLSPDGRYVLAVGEARLVRVWDLHEPSSPSLPGGEVEVTQFDLSSRGVIAGWDREGRGHVWESDPAVGKGSFQRRLLPTSIPGGVRLVLFHPAGDRVVTVGIDARVQLWSLGGGERVWEMSSGSNAPSVLRFTPDGQRLLLAGTDGRIQLREVTGGQEIGPSLEHGSAILDVAFSPDGRRLATAGVNGLVRLWEMPGGRLIEQGLAHESEVVRVSFSPDGTRLLTSVADGGSAALYAQLWDARTLTPMGERMQHRDGVVEARFFPDGSRVATAGEDGVARVWDGFSGAPLSQWMSVDRRIIRLEVSPDGRTLTTVDENGRLRLWDAVTGEPLGTPTPTERALAVRFVDDGRLVFSSLPGPLRLWEIPVEEGSVADLGDLARLSAGLEIDVSGGLSLLAPPTQQALMERLQVSHPDRFRITPFAPEWHRSEAERMKRSGNRLAEAFHRKQADRR